MKLSFVILNRNNQEFLNKCLFSIEKLSLKKKETILIDDASDDNSIKNLKYCPTKTIINKKRLGIAESRNIGFNNATGKYVFYIDSDIEIKHLQFKKIDDLFQSNTKLIAVSGNYHSLKDKDWNSVLDFRRRNVFNKNKTEYIYSLNRKYTTFSGGFCVLNRDLVKKIKQRGKLSNSGEDILFQVKLLNKGYYFAYIPCMEGVHYHKRSLFEALKKAKTEARGNIWLMRTLIQNNLKIPVLERIFTGPVLLILGLIFHPIFLLVEFFPYIILIVTQPCPNSLKLLSYTIYVEVLEIYYLAMLLLDLNFRAKNKLIFLKSILINSFQAKYKWAASKF